MTWTFDEALGHELVTVVSRDDGRRPFEVRIGSLLKPITLAIEVSEETGYVECKRSHALVTPLRHRTKQPGIGLRATLTFVPAFALHRVLDVMTKEYRAAVVAGHVPEEGWLVKR